MQGTGGFILAAYDYISKNYTLDKEQKKDLKFNTFKGQDIVDGVARLCVMNLYLHGIGGQDSPIAVGDSLVSDPGDCFEMVLKILLLAEKAVLQFLEVTKRQIRNQSYMKDKTSGQPHLTNN